MQDIQREGVLGGSGDGAPQNNKLNKRIEDLQDKLMKKTDDLSEAHRVNVEVRGHFICYVEGSGWALYV